MQVPPGWYPDPGQPAQPHERYWDGATWSSHVRPVAQHFPFAVAHQPTTPDGVPLAGWWQRLLALVIDSIAVGIVSSILTIPLQLRMQADLRDLLQDLGSSAQTPGSSPDFGAFWSDYLAILLPQLTWSALITFVLAAVYSSVFLRWKSATPGKMVLGISVRLRERPGQLPWSTIARRVLVQHGVAVFAVVPWLYLALSWFPLLDGLWAAWDSKRQSLHDKAARTSVVRSR